jgi:aminopeptidase N
MKQQNQSAMQNTLDPRSDTFDVISYEINAAFLSYETAKSIDGMCKINLTHKIASPSVTLDLMGLTVDSVLVKGVKTTFMHVGSKLKVDYGQSENGAMDISVYYRGNPMSDPQWGGFYFTGEYAFNLGVGFASDPHNFGRVWFPCFDNFTDRALYYTNVTVNKGYKAYANGYLTDEVDNGNQTVTFKWTMDDPIPTYLATVAMAKYEEVKMTVDGIPVLLTSLEQDTANLRSSFENIPTCIRRFEQAYGDHTFDRIGFNIVPFNSGAMEHATNIAYPLYAIGGGAKTNETLFAHELAHHWWGNTITCRTQEDMWLNEGWASYSERLFLEAVYGKDRYIEDIEDNHRDVLQFAHIRDGDVLPVSGIGHANTYGNHVYNKGADMVHTLRGMMGDEDFFEACASFQNEFKFKDVSTDDMKTHFQQFTPLSLTGFFDQWIKEKGFAHFDILWVLNTDATYQVRIKQTPRFNEVTYKNVVATVTAFSMDFERYDAQVVIMNDEQNFDIACPFEPVFWSFDFDDKISDAVTTDVAIIQPGGVKVDMPQSLMSEIWVNNPTDDSVMLRIEHHWAPADASYGRPAGAVLSKERYWNVDGIWGDDVNITSELIYSGLQSNSLIFGYLDKELIRITEDSLVLLYRPNASSAWAEATDYIKNSGSLFDKRGIIEVSNLKKGQYTLAMYDASLLNEKLVTVPKYEFKVFPNPAQDELNLEFAKKHDCCMVEVTNTQGQVVLSEKLKGRSSTKKLDISKLAPGSYFVGVVTDNLAYDVKRFVVE